MQTVYVLVRQQTGPEFIKDGFAHKICGVFLNIAAAKERVEKHLALDNFSVKWFDDERPVRGVVHGIYVTEDTYTHHYFILTVGLHGMDNWQ